MAHSAYAAQRAPSAQAATAEALSQSPDPRQLALYERRNEAARERARRGGHQAPLCAGCREKEARYGFRDEHDPIAARPRTLCFACFRVEIGRRQAVAAQLARGWNAQQVRLPLDETLQELTRRRRRAQIAARHALGI
jgi:hypothetical protein